MARPREFDEQMVLEAAKGRFCSTGYCNTSVDDLVTATGLGKGSLYGAFGDKHRLFLRVFGDYCTGVVEQAHDVLTGDDNGALHRLTTYLDQVAEATASDVTRRGCLLANGVAERAAHDPAIAALAHQAFSALEQDLVKTITAAQRHGDIHPEADASGLAFVLLAVMRGGEALGKAGADPNQIRKIAKTVTALIAHAPA